MPMPPATIDLAHLPEPVTDTALADAARHATDAQPGSTAFTVVCNPTWAASTRTRVEQVVRAALAADATVEFVDAKPAVGSTPAARSTPAVRSGPAVRSAAGSIPAHTARLTGQTMRMPSGHIVAAGDATDATSEAAATPPGNKGRRNLGGIAVAALALIVLAGGAGAVIRAQQDSATGAASGENGTSTTTVASSTTTTAANPPPSSDSPPANPDAEDDAGEELVAIPNVVGMDALDAEEQLVDLGLRVESVDDDESFRPQGRVSHQSVAAGETVPAGSTLVLSVSTGKAEAVIPYTIGMTEADAIDVLEEAGFADVDVIVIPDPDTPPGQVIRSQPDPGDEHEASRRVLIFVARSSE